VFADALVKLGKGYVVEGGQEGLQQFMQTRLPSSTTTKTPTRTSRRALLSVALLAPRSPLRHSRSRWVVSARHPHQRDSPGHATSRQPGRNQPRT
jgi:hypothetical protein